MHLYEDVVALFEAQIADGIYRVGDRIPSVRETSRSLRVSMSTVYNAYNALELKGLVRAKPKSGYVVVQQASKAADRGRPANTGLQNGPVLDLKSIALQILGADNSDAATQFGSAYPDSSFIPGDRLNCLMRDVSRRALPGRIRDPAGLIELRREIAKRYTRHGYAVSLDEIVITTGSIDGVNLALRAVSRPGDAIAVEDPCFFPVSFSLRQHGLRPVPVPVSPEHGLDLDVLEHVLATRQVKACVIMPSCHTPMGVSLSQEKQARLAGLVERYDVPLIENDAYGALRPPDDGNSTCKPYDHSGLVLHCSSFSNALSPQLRVGWISAGRFHHQVRSVKFLTNMASNWIAQHTAAEFLTHENVDRRMRAMRATLEERLRTGLRELDRWRGLVVRRSNPQHGFMVWAQLPNSVDTLSLFTSAVAERLSFVPGALFSVDRPRRTELGLNFSCRWTPEAVRSLDRLMSLAAAAAYPRQ